jgi:carbohydrate-binding DOMON domain-containing protein
MVIWSCNCNVVMTYTNLGTRPLAHTHTHTDTHTHTHEHTYKRTHTYTHTHTNAHTHSKPAIYLDVWHRQYVR